MLFSSCTFAHSSKSKREKRKKAAAANTVCKIRMYGHRMWKKTYIDTYSCIRLIYKHTDAYLKWMAWRDHVKKFIDFESDSLMICLLPCCCGGAVALADIVVIAAGLITCCEYESFSNCAKCIHVYVNISFLCHSTQTFYCGVHITVVIFYKCFEHHLIHYKWFIGSLWVLTTLIRKFIDPNLCSTETG